MPTALEAGWYHSKGFHDVRQRQYVRARGFPLPSTYANAASSSGVMTAVACSRNRGPYSRHVSAKFLSNALSSGNNSSVGLWRVWYSQLTASQHTKIKTAATGRLIAGWEAQRARRNARASRHLQRRKRQTDPRRGRRGPR